MYIPWFSKTVFRRDIFRNSCKLGATQPKTKERKTSNCSPSFATETRIPSKSAYGKPIFADNVQVRDRENYPKRHGAEKMGSTSQSGATCPVSWWSRTKRAQWAGASPWLVSPRKSTGPLYLRKQATTKLTWTKTTAKSWSSTWQPPPSPLTSGSTSY